MLARTGKSDKVEEGAQPLACWNCEQAPGGVHFCERCGALQPPSGDYFEYLGLPHKLQIDLGALEKTFYALSRRLHPDVYCRRSEREQKLAEDATARLNDAYRTLKNPVARAWHLLELQAICNGERKASQSAAQQTSADELLEEVFELKLAIEQARRGDDSVRPQLVAARSRFQGLLYDADHKLEAAVVEWDRTGDRATLEQLLAILSRRSFVEKILRDIGAALPAPAPPSQELSA